MKSHVSGQQWLRAIFFASLMLNIISISAAAIFVSRNGGFGYIKHKIG